MKTKLTGEVTPGNDFDSGSAANKCLSSEVNWRENEKSVSGCVCVYHK